MSQYQYVANLGFKVEFFIFLKPGSHSLLFSYTPPLPGSLPTDIPARRYIPPFSTLRTQATRNLKVGCWSGVQRVDLRSEKYVSLKKVIKNKTWCFGTAC